MSGLHLDVGQAAENFPYMHLSICISFAIDKQNKEQIMTRYSVQYIIRLLYFSPFTA